jgi:predicted aspartyl protease
MHLHVRLGDATLHALVDTGSTHNFLSQEAAARVHLPLVQRAGLRVTVANGDKVPSPGMFQDARISIDTEVFITDLYVLPLGGYDLVLGMQWLSTLGQILWDFGQLTMSFWHKDHMVLWRGLPTGASPAAHVATTRDLLDDLLTEFADVFATPSGLPPPRHQDHRITLLPDTAPVAVRPYRYSARHKDELERQCRDMEAQGIIRRSSSAFSSPVLLVKKADGSWRFCVDYRALILNAPHNSTPYRPRLDDTR